MQFLIDNWILILAALTSGALLAWPMIKGGGGAGTVSTAEAVRLINREKGVLLDVSEPAEFAAGHAGGARNVPLGQLDGAATGANAVSLSAGALGGGGGAGGGAGAAVAQTNAVGGGTVSGSLSLAQTANGGSGGAATGALVGGAGGAATSTPSFDDFSENLHQSAALSGTVYAYWGNGASGVTYGDGGTASASLRLIGAGTADSEAARRPRHRSPETTSPPNRQPMPAKA